MSKGLEIYHEMLELRKENVELKAKAEKYDELLPKITFGNAKLSGFTNPEGRQVVLLPIEEYNELQGQLTALVDGIKALNERFKFDVKKEQNDDFGVCFTTLGFTGYISVDQYSKIKAMLDVMENK